jgi:hypothetical protein
MPAIPELFVPPGRVAVARALLAVEGSDEQKVAQIALFLANSAFRMAFRRAAAPPVG